MKSTIFFMLFTLLLCADNEMPQWIIKDPDTKGKYFRGTSSWYVTNDARMEKLAKEDAMHNAYSFVSEYFGVNIASSFEMNEKVVNNQKTLNTTTNVKAKTNQLMLDMKPLKEFIESDESEENFRLHVLILLDRVGENRIRREMLKDKQEFQALKNKALKAIENKEYFKAKNFLELAKGKRNAFVDDTIKKIETRLQKLINGLILSNLTINKSIYMPDEYIQLEASLNQDGYMYIFYETSSDVEMIFPNESNRVAFVKKEKLLSFGNEDEDRIVAYEEDLNKPVKFYIIASKKNLALKGLSDETSEGIYIFGKTGKYQDVIERCLGEGDCTKKVVPFKISNVVNAKAIKLVINSDKRSNITKYFKSKGVVSKESSTKLVFDIKKYTSYSQQLETTIETYKIKAKLYKNGSRIKILHDESSPSELNEYLFDMYRELNKKY
ncbi:DUF4384 domain-containing protein [Sulfurimonas sp.]|nr:DUF4384 domain-containing protein [Sulfurimonas sp.]